MLFKVKVTEPNQFNSIKEFLNHFEIPYTIPAQGVYRLNNADDDITFTSWLNEADISYDTGVTMDDFGIESGIVRATADRNEYMTNFRKLLVALVLGHNTILMDKNGLYHYVGAPAVPVSAEPYSVESRIQYELYGEYPLSQDAQHDWDSEVYHSFKFPKH